MLAPTSSKGAVMLERRRFENTRAHRPASALTAACLVLFTLSIAASAQAEVVHEQEPNHAVWAARACYLEASFREADCIALLYVARKRAERVSRPWFAVLRDYSAIDADNPRAREVREYPWGDIPGKPAAFNARWERLRQLVVEVASGQRQDPCPRAEHWGGKMDKPQGRMVPARCAVSTANTFYTLRPRRAAVVTRARKSSVVVSSGKPVRR
jgi:hypothetical protein